MRAFRFLRADIVGGSTQFIFDVNGYFRFVAN